MVIDTNRWVLSKYVSISGDYDVNDINISLYVNYIAGICCQVGL